MVARIPNLRFENDVVSNGSQTRLSYSDNFTPFENDVVSNGSQTNQSWLEHSYQFENDVVSNGSQTSPCSP